jgi:beta-glucanase (GH16 family)
MSIPVNSTWKLTFDDEFNGTSLDTSKWSANWFGAPGAITKPANSAETAAYDPAQVSVSGGALNLDAVTSPVTVNGVNYNYRTGMVQSDGNFEQTYGYFEARVYLPGSGGQIANWPAFWLDGHNWPTDGELDVMEGLGGQAAYHFHSPSGGPGSAASGNYTGWHTFGADWESGKVDYYYDDQLVGTITAGITNAPMYVILNNAMGTWGGPQMVPSDMKVDWVHVYSKDSSATAVTAETNYTGPGGTGIPVASGGGGPTTTPTVTISAIDGNDVINHADAMAGVLINGTATDTGGGAEVAGQTVTVGLNGKTYSGTVQSDGAWSATVAASDAQALSDGSHTVTANITDKAGNPASQVSQAVTVDETAPTLTMNAIDGNNVITQGNAAAGILISGTATDANGSADVTGQTVTVGLNGKTYTGVVQANGTWSANVAASAAEALGDGGYTVTANAADKAGNWARQASQAVTVDAAVTVDGDSGPEPPTLNVSSSSLRVAAGGSVALGVSVGAVDADDVVSISISGVPRYESITAAGATAAVSHHGHTYTFSALPAADWANGLVLHSTYTGSNDPTATLMVTASNTTAGETAAAPARWIDVTDPPAAITQSTIGLKDPTRFLAPSPATDRDELAASRLTSFKQLVALARSSLPTDLLNVTKSVWGADMAQSGKGFAMTDLTFRAKHGAGQLEDHTAAKPDLKSFLKLHDDA